MQLELARMLRELARTRQEQDEQQGMTLETFLREVALESVRRRRSPWAVQNHTLADWVLCRPPRESERSFVQEPSNSIMTGKGPHGSLRFPPESLARKPRLALEEASSDGDESGTSTPTLPSHADSSESSPKILGIIIYMGDF